jgi:NAD(P)-dependent dehydrogenase (short-subunit alcohol dehydrogenase family)
MPCITTQALAGDSKFRILFESRAQKELRNGKHTKSSDPKTAAKIVDTAVSRFGRIDVLINNANCQQSGEGSVLS